ncbi:MAG: ThiF family adenylyltransferase [Gammaproteobacteria bacterium]
MPSFHYETAFARNIGWLSHEEQQLLRAKRVAIAGMGGVGGSHLVTLTRLGIGAFTLADFDVFELANFNRQAGASTATVGNPKVDVLAQMALDINPELQLRSFGDGVDAGNVDDFLSGVDLYLDALDFFAVEARRTVFGACARLGIPAVTAAPLGMGAALLNFLPGKMTFEEYFRLEGQEENEQLLRFLLGLSPAMLQRTYLVDPTAVDFHAHRGPSTPMACELCAGVAATEVAKILLGRGRVFCAPRGLQFDAYRNKLTRTWRPGGNRNPIQRLGLWIARRQLARFGRDGAGQAPGLMEPLRTVEEKIVDRARWAPSGDNTQPWRLEIAAENHIVVHGSDTRDHVVYDLQGHASQIALGALLETMIIAATEHGMRATFERRTDAPETTPTFDVHLSAAPATAPHPLAPFVPVRSVQRRALRTRPLTAREKAELEQAVGHGFEVRWIEGLRGRLQVAGLAFRSAGLRLTLPEAYPVHKQVIEWNARYSDDRIPDQALGVDSVTVRLMAWAMQSWKRVRFLNRFFAGTLLPRIEMELIPGIACGAHFLLLGAHRCQTVDEFVEAGRALQRFWLTATRLGLQMQPELTPLIFHEYMLDGVRFSATEAMYGRARRVSEELRQVAGDEEADRAAFMGRIGEGSVASSRSRRRSIDDLLISVAQR